MTSPANTPVGANLLFADGSARFIRSITTDGLIRRAYWAMGTRAGGVGRDVSRFEDG